MTQAQMHARLFGQEALTSCAPSEIAEDAFSASLALDTARTLLEDYGEEPTLVTETGEGFVVSSDRHVIFMGSDGDTDIKEIEPSDNDTVEDVGHDQEELSNWFYTWKFPDNSTHVLAKNLVYDILQSRSGGATDGVWMRELYARTASGKYASLRQYLTPTVVAYGSGRMGEDIEDLDRSEGLDLHEYDDELNPVDEDMPREMDLDDFFYTDQFPDDATHRAARTALEKARESTDTATETALAKKLHRVMPESLRKYMHDGFKRMLQAETVEPTFTRVVWEHEEDEHPTIHVLENQTHRLLMTPAGSALHGFTKDDVEWLTSGAAAQEVYELGGDYVYTRDDVAQQAAQALTECAYQPTMHAEITETARQVSFLSLIEGSIPQADLLVALVGPSAPPADVLAAQRTVQQFEAAGFIEPMDDAVQTYVLSEDGEAMLHSAEVQALLPITEGMPKVGQLMAHDLLRDINARAQDNVAEARRLYRSVMDALQKAASNYGIAESRASGAGKTYEFEFDIPLDEELDDPDDDPDTIDAMEAEIIAAIQAAPGLAEAKRSFLAAFDTAKAEADEDAARIAFDAIMASARTSDGESDEDIDEARDHAVITKGKDAASMRMGDQTAGEPYRRHGGVKKAIDHLTKLAKTKWKAKSVEVIEESVDEASGRPAYVVKGKRVRLHPDIVKQDRKKGQDPPTGGGTIVKAWQSPRTGDTVADVRFDDRKGTFSVPAHDLVQESMDEAKIDRAAVKKAATKAAKKIFDEPDPKIIDSMIDNAINKKGAKDTEDAIQMVISMMRSDEAVEEVEDDELVEFQRRSVAARMKARKMRRKPKTGKQKLALKKRRIERKRHKSKYKRKEKMYRRRAKSFIKRRRKLASHEEPVGDETIVEMDVFTMPADEATEYAAFLVELGFEPVVEVQDEDTAAVHVPHDLAEEVEALIFEQSLPEDDDDDDEEDGEDAPKPPKKKDKKNGKKKAKKDDEEDDDEEEEGNDTNGADEGYNAIAGALALLEDVLPDTGGHWGEVKQALTFLLGNGMLAEAKAFVEGLKTGDLSEFSADLSVGETITSPYVFGKVTPRVAVVALGNLNARLTGETSGVRESHVPTLLDQGLGRKVDEADFEAAVEGIEAEESEAAHGVVLHNYVSEGQTIAQSVHMADKEPVYLLALLPENHAEAWDAVLEGKFFPPNSAQSQRGQQPKPPVDTGAEGTPKDVAESGDMVDVCVPKADLSRFVEVSEQAGAPDDAPVRSEGDNVVVTLPEDVAERVVLVVESAEITTPEPALVD